MTEMVSIITPVYNGEATLNRCIESVLAQSEQDFTLILIDDGSTDGSGAICDRYAASDPRITVIHQENRGVSAARNAGLDRARGTYVTFLDSDDELEPDYLRGLLTRAVQTGVDAVVCGLKEMVDGLPGPATTLREQVFGPEIWNEISSNSLEFGRAGGKLLRRSLLEEPPVRFSTAMVSQEDLDFVLEVYSRCRRIQTTPESRYCYARISGKRTPPIFDFLANQMKIYRLGISNTRLTTEAENALTARVEELIYCALYEKKTLKEIQDWVARMHQVQGLRDFLNTHRSRSKAGMVAHWAAQSHIWRIFGFFKLYHKAKKLLRR